MPIVHALFHEMKLSSESDVYFDTMSDYVNVSEYAKIKGVHERTVYRWIENGDILAEKITGKWYVKADGDSENGNGKDVIIANLMSENRHLQKDIEYLQTQLSQALQTNDKMQEDRQRSDTIIMQLTKQLEQQTLMLEDMRQRSIWRRLKAVFATEAM